MWVCIAGIPRGTPVKNLRHAFGRDALGRGDEVCHFGQPQATVTTASRQPYRSAGTGKGKNPTVSIGV